MDYLIEAENDIKSYFETHQIPPYFYQCLFAEFIKVFGIQFLIPDKEYLAEYDDDGNILESNNDDYSYKDQIAYYLTMLSGTFGWTNAFAMSCEQCKLSQLLQYYHSTDWVRGDIFDGYIVDKMVDALFDENNPRGYGPTTYLI
jgi:hypothetical protein